MKADLDDHYDLLEEMCERCDAVERRWFMENFWPDYKLSMDVARDLLEPASHPQFAPDGSSFSRVSMDGNNRLRYTKADVMAMHAVSEQWIALHVTGFLTPGKDRTGGVWGKRRAANKYSCYLGRMHPRMPLQRVAELVHEFIPTYTMEAVRRALIAEGLMDSRREVNVTLGLFIRGPHAESASDFIDALYEGDEYD